MTVKVIASPLLKFLLSLQKKKLFQIIERARILYFHKHKIDFVAEFFVEEKRLFSESFDNGSFICRYTTPCSKDTCNLYSNCANYKFFLKRSEKEKRELDSEGRASLAWKIIDKKYEEGNAKIFMALVMALDDDDVEECLEKAITFRGKIKAFCLKEFLGIQVTPISDME